MDFPFDNELSALKMWKQDRSLLDKLDTSMKRCCNILSVLQ